MTYTIETLRTVAGKRYYIRCEGRLMRSGFANRTAAVERIRLLEVMDRDREQLRGQIRSLREERSA